MSNYHNLKIQIDKYKKYLLSYLFLDNKNGWMLDFIKKFTYKT